MKTIIIAAGALAAASSIAVAQDAPPAIFADLQRIEDDTRQGFTNAELEFEKIRHALNDIGNGFDDVEAEFHRQSGRAASAAALASIPAPQSRGFSVGGAVAVDYATGDYAGAVAIFYSTARASLSLTATRSRTGEGYIGGGVTIKLNR